MLVRIFVVVAAVCSFFSVNAQDEGVSVDLTPKFHGALRTRWEMDTESGASRFQVRNARVSIEGRIAPSISYYAQTDLCDRGSMKILDAWGRVGITDNLFVQAGQYRMPFGVDPFRGPASYVFSNRSFVGKQICNVRAVGVKASYTLPSVPVTVEGGVFNPTSISDHNKYVKTMAYAAKATWSIGNVKLATGLQSLEPDSVRINLVDAGVTWKAGRWTVEGEYMNKHYTNSAHKACSGWVLWADYAMPVKVGVFNSLSVQARYDGMTDHSNGHRNDEGKLFTSDKARDRITAGATLAYRSGAVWCLLRASYEQYFYRHGFIPAVGEGNRAVLEMVVHF